MVLIEEEEEDEHQHQITATEDTEQSKSHSHSRGDDVSNGASIAQSTDVQPQPEPVSTNKDVSDGFETASDDDDFDRRSDLSGEENTQQQQQQQEVSGKGDSYEDACDDDQLKEKALAQANDAKVEGNSLFKEAQYEDALSKYEAALQVAPEMPSSVELRSICHANRAICFLKLGKHEETVKECTKAIELNPAYVKALVRRGEALEKLERYDEAIADMKKILELDPSNDQARRNIVRLEPLAREKMEKMKEEMLGKLKDMGNSLLGRFGMNIDNFKAVKDPDTGSYSISFQR